MKRVLSLGAGVQSSTLYLMAAAGAFGVARPEVAIFADTQWEPAAVYTWLAELERIAGHIIPIRRVTAGNIRDGGVATRSRFASLPLYVESGNVAGKLRRQCTREYKIEPVTKEIRRNLLGLAKGERIKRGITVELWMGISLDEAARMKPNRTPWITSRWPLIEREMRRTDCLKWLAAHGYPEPPKSACIGCPFTNDTRWRDMKQNRPAEFADAADFDRAIRTSGRGRGVLANAYLHRSLLPLDAVDFSTQEDNGQMNWLNECEGMCGV